MACKPCIGVGSAITKPFQLTLATEILRDGAFAVSKRIVAPRCESHTHSHRSPLQAAHKFHHCG